MNTQLKHKKTATVILLVICSLLFSIRLMSQVTIGSGISPNRAALLDLKTRQESGTISSVTDSANITAAEGDGGLLLPRVKLVNIHTLEPLIPTSDTDWIANTNSLKERLAGLMVYNITNNGFGSSLYPAVYTWNGALWTTSQVNQAASSITFQPQPFTFYERGTETPEDLTFGVDGLGTWTYQWYQVTGNNVHVRIGTPIGGSGTISAAGTGSTTASFKPLGVIKGTTRNANYTGFYKFYCVAQSSLGAEFISNIAEVAVGCGAKNNAGEWVTFMCFNLGATDHTIMAQKGHAMTFSPPNDVDGRHSYIANEETVYGDLYQWGRIGDGHEKYGVGLTPGQSSAGTNQIAYGSGVAFENGNFIRSIPYPWQQVQRGTPHYGKFILVGQVQNYNWANNLPSSEMDLLWRTGRFAANDPCAKIKDDGITTETYYPQTGGIDGSNTNWRIPTQEEWGAIYKGGTMSGSPGSSTANTWIWNSTNCNGYEIRPDNVTTTLFLPATGLRGVLDGLLYHQGVNGDYWTSSTIGTSAYRLLFSSVTIYPGNTQHRGHALAIRCIKNQ